ncbi:hypothetical protein LAZ40_04595 [Cereibacter sphaeroides]|uniref:hypothetical protein n=1 Tax=Cereibacter sphaeroides TaxID=1063 RepID=UPI001F1DD9D7|nr:hypothetical protein [Cereibacter sphaeroides]MCE6958334.1 hypothetical protein [Cereibacter sphaeroides]MCE6972201.1 hypothetical protein [Cereibacter sphaeroides]
MSEVAGPGDGPFTCAGCGGPLSYRAPARARRHFAHRPGAPCSGETALHAYAKAVLSEEGWLALPERVLKDRNFRERVSSAHPRFRFDRIEIEVAVSDFQPDALGWKGSERLAIEFRVTHAVDEVKRGRVASVKLTMLEISLDATKALRLGREDLRAYILAEAPRSWIFHRRDAEARVRLADRREEDLAARRRGLRHRMEHPPVRPLTDEVTRALDTVRDFGLSHLVGRPTSWQHWFTVPADCWQAERLERLVIRACSDDEEGRALDLDRRDFGGFPSGFLNEALPDHWQVEEFMDADTYGSPERAVQGWLDTLRREGILTEPKPGRLRVPADLCGRIARRGACRRAVRRLLSGLPDPEAALASWWTASFRKGEPPERLVQAGGAEWTLLRDDLERLGNLRRASGSWPEDLCGLPLEALVTQREAADARRRERVEQAERKRRAEEEERNAQEAAHRVALLAERAREALGPWEGGRWLDFPLPEGSPRDLAASGSAGLARAREALAALARQRDEEASRASRLARIEEAARMAFRRPEEAQLFLTSTSPALGRRRPCECVTSDAETEKVLAHLRTLVARR